MAAKSKPETKTGAAVPEKETPAAKPERKFVVDKLRTHCFTLFGVTSSTFDGAMHGHDLDKLYTIDEVKKIIDGFLNGGK